MELNTEYAPLTRTALDHAKVQFREHTARLDRECMALIEMASNHLAGLSHAHELDKYGGPASFPTEAMELVTLRQQNADQKLEIAKYKKLIADIRLG